MTKQMKREFAAANCNQCSALATTHAHTQAAYTHTHTHTYTL